MRYSIIIPYCNAERTIGACLESVEAAVRRYGMPCEIICVNDGSTDASEGIVRAHTPSLSGIRLLSQANAGPGAARNAALDSATGDYIVFVDADDTLTEDALSRLAGQEADIITFLPPAGNWNMSLAADRRALFQPLVGNLLAWNAVYRRTTIGDWRFPNLHNHEDIIWTAGAFAHAKTIVCGIRPWYRHHPNISGSLNNTYSWRRVCDGIAATRLLARATRPAHAGTVTRLVLVRKLAMHLLLHVAAAAIKALSPRRMSAKARRP